jgi:branched-chain amino acid transport system ATP-binding protein
MQSGNIFPSLTVQENLEIGGYLLNKATIKERISGIFGLFPVLAERQGTRAGLLSGGQRQMLALGMILMNRPDLILLDEPSAGLSPGYVKEVMARIGQINREFRTTFLIVEQNIQSALDLAHRVYCLRNGVIASESTPDKLRESKLLERIFMT